MYTPILYFTVLTNVPIRFTDFFDGYQDYIADHLTVTIVSIVYRLATVSIQFQFGLAFFTFYILNNFSVLSVEVLILN